MKEELMTAQEGFLYRLSTVLMRRRLLVVLFCLIGGGVLAYGVTRIKTEVILQHLFPYDHPYLQLHARFSQVFGGGGFGVVMAVKAKNGDIFNKETLSKVKKITDEIVLWEEAYRVLTVSIAGQSTKVVKTLAKGEIVIDTLMFPDIPKTEEEMTLLKKHIFSDPSYNGILVSRDGTAALILAQLKEHISYERAFELLRHVDTTYSDEDTSIHIVGYPMLMGWIYSYKPQMYMVFAISVALMILILYFIFRNFVGMIAPIAMATICTGMGLGFIGWTGINFSPLLYVLAFLVGARMLSNAVQITHRYVFEYRSCEGGLTPRQIAGRNTMLAMMMPNAAAVATDAAGFLILGFAKIVLMQQLAIMMSFWMLTIVLSGVLVPIICSYLPRLGEALDHCTDEKSILERIITGMAGFSIGVGRYAVGFGVIVIIVFCGWQTTKLKVGDPTPGSPILWPNHEFNQDVALINNTFDASSENFMLFYEGEPESVYDPIVSKTFEAFSSHMAETLPDIYKSSSSINNFGKMLNVTFHDGDKLWYQMPRDSELLEGLLGQIRNNIDRGTLGRFMDSTLERAQITLYFSDHTSVNMRRIRQAAYEFFKDNPMKTQGGEFKLAGGAIGLEIAVNDEMQRTHAIMDAMVLFAIFIMCTIAFRSFVAGAMLAVPLLLSNLVAFAYMAAMDIGLSTNTLPCSAVGVGVGVDFSIYLYSRCIEEFPKFNVWEKTVFTVVQTAGKGIVFTGITLIFPILIWYFISDLKFQAQMGFFLSILLFINMIAALTLHPLLIIIFKPRFMMKGQQETYSESAGDMEPVPSGT